MSQEEQMKLVYTQLLDSDQVLYALSLLQAVLSVHPHSIITSLADSLVSPTTYGAQRGSGFVFGEQSTAGPGQKSLLEVILLSLAAFVRSEYAQSLDVTIDNVVENLKVKSTAVEMIGFLMLQFYLILSSSTDSHSVPGGSGRTGDTSRGLVHNPSYISALVTLCDVQKVLLLSLSQVVRYLREAATVLGAVNTTTNGGNPVINGTDRVKSGLGEVGQIPSVPLQVLFVNLLRSLRNLICLESQCIPSSPVPTTPSSSAKHAKRSLSFPAGSAIIHPGLSTAAQPFFQSLFVDTLADSSLSDLHPHLLHMFSASLPHLSTQLDTLAPKILRQICRNLEASVDAERHRSTGERESQSGCGGRGVAAVIGNLQALVHIILCCLFGEFPSEPVSLSHASLNRFWDVDCASRSEESEEATSPTSKQPSTMSWLLGVFAGQSKPAASLPVGAKSPKLGLSQGRVGQSIRLLLPAVYNSLTEVWTWLRGRATVSEGGGVVSGSNDRGSWGGGKSERGVWLEAEKRRAEYKVSVTLTYHHCLMYFYVYVLN